MDKVIIIGGGHSIKEGISLGLWDKIKDYEKWSLNSAFKVMPYLPNKQLWVDIDFIDNNLEELQDIHSKGVELVSKKFSNRKRYSFFEKLNLVTQYDTTREASKYFGKDAVNNGLIYYGQMGLCGGFALAIAIGMGYKEIYCLGYDFGSPSLQHKETHFYQDQMLEKKISSTGAGRPEVYRLPGGQLRRELEDWKIYNSNHNSKIYNVSLISNLNYFEKISYEDFFKKLEA